MLCMLGLAATLRATTAPPPVSGAVPPGPGPGPGPGKSLKTEGEARFHQAQFDPACWADQAHYKDN